MGVLKWAVLGAVAIALAGAHTGYATIFADGAQAEDTRYLVDRYKAAPTRTAGLIRQHASTCLAEHIGKQASVDLENLFGEIMVYMVRHVERDGSAFISGYRALAEREGPAVDAKIAFLPKAEKRRIAALVDDFASGPHAMAGCVARKLKAVA